MQFSRLRKAINRPRDQAALLDPRTASALERAPDLYLTARTMVEGLYQGRHQTRQRGASTEFYDFRVYAPGDPAHRVDWKVFGRTDRLYVRRFRHTAQLTVMFVVDRSPSMSFAGLGSGGVTKYRRACELAAALAFLATRQSDRVGIVIGASPDDLRVVPPGTGRQGLHAVISALEACACEESGTARPHAVSAGIDAALGMLPRRSLIVALTDALDEAEPMLASAARARHGVGGGGGGIGGGHDLALIQTLTPDELDISGLGGAKLVDQESGASVRTLGRSIAPKYRAAFEEHLRQVREGFSGLGARSMIAMTNTPAIESLRSFLSGG